MIGPHFHILQKCSLACLYLLRKRLNGFPSDCEVWVTSRDHLCRFSHHRDVWWVWGGNDGQLGNRDVATWRSSYTVYSYSWFESADWSRLNRTKVLSVQFDTVKGFQDSFSSNWPDTCDGCLQKLPQALISRLLSVPLLVTLCVTVCVITSHYRRPVPVSLLSASSYFLDRTRLMKTELKAILKQVNKSENTKITVSPYWQCSISWTRIIVMTQIKANVRHGYKCVCLCVCGRGPIVHLAQPHPRSSLMDLTGIMMVVTMFPDFKSNWKEGLCKWKNTYNITNNLSQHDRCMIRYLYNRFFWIVFKWAILSKHTNRRTADFTLESSKVVPRGKTSRCY